MRISAVVLLCVVGIMVSASAEDVTVVIDLAQEDLPDAWEVTAGSWALEEGELRQENVREHPARLFFATPMLSDFEFSASFKIAPTDRTVRAADFVFRAADTANYLYFHCNSQMDMVALARSTDQAYWTEAQRTPDVGLKTDTWHQARIVGKGDEFTFFLDGKKVASGENPNSTAGCIGLGSCSAQVAFKDIEIRGTRAVDASPFHRGPTWHARVATVEISGAPRLEHAADGAIICTWADENGRVMQAESRDQGMNWRAVKTVSEDLATEETAVIQDARGRLAIGAEMRVRRHPAGVAEGTVSPEPLWPGRDPVLAASADGEQVLLFLIDGDRGLHVLRSFDFGVTWQGPIILADNAQGRVGALQLRDGSWLVAHACRRPAALVVSRLDPRGRQVLPVPVGLRLSERSEVTPTMSDGAVVVAPPTTRINPRNTEGSIVELKDGRLLLAYTRFYGGGSDHAYADISGMISEDGGKTWGRPFLMQRNDAGCNVMSATLLRLRSGEILFGYLRKNQSRDDCRFYVRASRDEGESWSPDVCATPEPVEYYVVNNDRVIQLSSGRLVVPAADHADWQRRRQAWAVCYLSDDNGRTWRRGRGHVELGGVGCQEPGVVELSDGRVYMIIRSSLGTVYKAVSEDGGDTWSEPSSTGLSSPTAPATIKRIPSTGDLLLVWNNSKTRTRVPLTAAISRDDGETWTNIRNIETEGRSFAYTSVCFVDNAAILTYWTSMTGGMGVKVRKIPVAWFYSPEGP